MPAPQRLSDAFSNALQGEHGRERKLIFLCARTRMDDAALNRADELLDGELDWTYVERASHFHGVAALVYLSLRNAFSERIPADVHGRMRLHFGASGLAVHALLDEFIEMAEAFEAKQIPLILFKGPALAQRAYGDLSRRKPGDLDVLVHKEDFVRASRVLAKRGYGLEGVYQRGLQFDEIPEYIEAKKGVTFYNGRHAVDLHWTLDDYPISVNLDLQSVWKRSQSVMLKQRPVPSLSTEDLLHFLCCHGAKHNWSRLSLTCDIAELLRSHPEISWEHVLCEARATRRVRMLFLGLALACDFLDVALPDYVRREIARDRQVRFLAGKLGTWLFSGARTAHIHMTRLILLESFREKGAYLVHRWARSRG